MMTSIRHGWLAAFAAIGFSFAVASPAQTTTVTFDDGADGFDGNGSVEQDGGNPDANVHFLIENFGIELRTDTNPAFVGDFTADDAVTIGLDTRVDSITFEGSEVSRHMIVEFRSRALAQGGYPYTSVFYDLGTLQAGSDWRTWSTTFDPRSEELPPGWGGYGAEDPDTAAPELPPGVTFTDVMAAVDELAFTTYEPGFFYGFTDFDVRFDNLTVTHGSGDVDAIFADGFEIE